MEPDRWLGVDLRHLAALEAVAREGSFGRAASSLGYTQSAVSQQIASLERIVGERLIDRPGGPRPVSLTAAGELLLRHAAAIVARLKAAEADLAALRAGEAGTLRIGTYQSVGARILPTLMSRFRREWPRVEIQLTESARDEELLRLVERGEVDLTFTTLPVTEGGPFEAAELMRDPYVVVVPADSPLADLDRPLRVRDLAGEPIIGFRQCRSVELAEAALRTRGVDPNIVFRSDDNGTVQGLVAAGIGLAVVPLLTVSSADHRVVVLEPDPKLPPRIIGLAWHRDRYRAPAARAFADAAQALCADLEREQQLTAV